MSSQRLTSSRPCSRHAILDSRQPPDGSRWCKLPTVQFGLLVFLPLYGPALPHATLEERRRNLYGYVTGVFQIGAMVEAALQGLEREGIVLRIEDEAAPADRRMLYDSHARESEDLGLARDAARGKPPMRMHWQTTVELAGRRWGLHFAPMLEYLATRQSLQHGPCWAVGWRS